MMTKDSSTARCKWNAARQRTDGTSFWMTDPSRHLPVELARAPAHAIRRHPRVCEGPGEKIHPHHFCNARELLSLVSGFEILRLADRPHDRPGSWHWHLLAERLA